MGQKLRATTLFQKLISSGPTITVGQVLAAKKFARELSRDEIQFLANGYVAGRIHDYQMAAFLAFVRMNGMTDRETTDLTLAMMNSGSVLDLSSVPGIKIDKHSTGGVGDGTSFPLIALMGTFGVIVPMMSGRGLGHTGGTLDKLEAIPGLSVSLTPEEVIDQLRRIGIALFSQTDDIVPADKMMYALRGATQTVDSIPLIAASIVSKKLAEGVDRIVLNVTTGSGAFMRDPQEARKLAQLMVTIAKGAGRQAVAVITSMDQPLGMFAGNALEIEQSIRVLSGETKGFEDFLEVVYALGTQMLVLAGILPAEQQHLGRVLLQQKIASGEAFEKFAQLIEAQGGDRLVADHLDRLPQARHVEVIEAPESGYVLSINTEQVGWAACYLGAGRQTLGAEIDRAVGIKIEAKVGSHVEKGQPLARFFVNERDRLPSASQTFLDAYRIGSVPPTPMPLILETIASPLTT